MRAVNHGVACPCHGCQAANGITDVVQAGRALLSKGRARTYAVPATEPTTDYAFEVSAANLRFGSGVTVSPPTIAWFGSWCSAIAYVS